MSDSQSPFERDYEVAWERYPKEMARLDPLRAYLADDFQFAYQNLRQQGCLLPQADGTYILASQFGEPTVGMRLHCDQHANRAVDLAMVFVPACPLLIEVAYDLQNQTAPPQPPAAPLGERPVVHDCQGERRQASQSQRIQSRGWGEWWMGADFVAERPKLQPGAIPLPRDPGFYEFERELALTRRERAADSVPRVPLVQAQAEGPCRQLHLQGPGAQ